MRRFRRPLAAAMLMGAAALAAPPAQALIINAGFETGITGSANAVAIESAIHTAVGSIANLYSDPGTVNILFNVAPGSFLGQTNNALYADSYADYTHLLALDAASHPANTVLATAVANLSHGNDANGSRNIVATSALFRVALGVAATPCFNANGGFVSGCGQTYDAVVTLSSSQPISYTRPLPGGTSYDAIRVIQHEVDEVLGGGGAGSALNSIAQFGLNNSAHSFTSDDGPLDLYRYSAAGTPSFSTSGSATSYFSVNGGVTNIVGFNQNSAGDFGDFLSTGCVADVQDAFSCANQTANLTKSSPEYKMLEAIGYDPVPEPASIILLAAGLCGMTLTRRRRRA